jgi:hypothetical protein
MIKFHSENIRRDIERFHEECAHYMKHSKEHYNRLLEILNNAPEDIKDKELSSFKQDYKGEMERFIARSPLYVGKRWRNCGVYASFNRISKVEWEFPNITDDRLYPVIKSITVDDCYKDGKVDRSDVTEYPESNEDFIRGLETKQFNDLDDC